MSKGAWARVCRKLPAKIGNALTAKQYKEAEELGILVDKDDQARPANVVVARCELIRKAPCRPELCMSSYRARCGLQGCAQQAALLRLPPACQQKHAQHAVADLLPPIMAQDSSGHRAVLNLGYCMYHHRPKGS